MMLLNLSVLGKREMCDTLGEDLPLIDQNNSSSRSENLKHTEQLQDDNSLPTADNGRTNSFQITGNPAVLVKGPKNVADSFQNTGNLSSSVVGKCQKNVAGKKKELANEKDTIQCTEKSLKGDVSTDLCVFERKNELLKDKSDNHKTAPVLKFHYGLSKTSLLIVCLMLTTTVAVGELNTTKLKPSSTSHSDESMFLKLRDPMITFETAACIDCVIAGMKCDNLAWFEDEQAAAKMNISLYPTRYTVLLTARGDSYNYTLCLKHLTPVDINHVFRCECNFQLVEERLSAIDTNATFVSKTIFQGYEDTNNIIRWNVSIANVYPEPKCTIIHISNLRFVDIKAQTSNSSIFPLLETDYTITFSTSECNGIEMISISCNVGIEQVVDANITICINNTMPSENTLKTIAGIIAGLVATTGVCVATVCIIVNKCGRRIHIKGIKLFFQKKAKTEDMMEDERRSMTNTELEL